MKQKIIISFFILSPILASLFLALSIREIQNYLEPFLFVISFGILGFFLGNIIALKLRNIICYNQKISTNYSTVKFIFYIFFIPFTIYSCSLLNNFISYEYKCNQYIVVGKKQENGGFRKLKYSSLTVNIDSENREIIVEENDRQKIKIGERVNICLYKSPIGFNQFNLKN